MIDRPDLHNLRTSRKELKEYQKVGIELSICDNTKSRQIQILPMFLDMS